MSSAQTIHTFSHKAIITPSANCPNFLKFYKPVLPGRLCSTHVKDTTISINGLKKGNLESLDLEERIKINWQYAYCAAM